MDSFIDGLEKLIETAAGRGASYTGIGFQRRDYEYVEVSNKVLKEYTSRTMSGVGIRVAYKGALGYASTSDISPGGLMKVLEAAIKAARSMPSGGGEPLTPVKVEQVEVGLPFRVDPFEVPPAEKVSVVMDANKAAWNSDSIRSATTRMGLAKDDRLFISSEGARVRVVAPLVGLAHSSVAQVESVKEGLGSSESSCAGYEFIEDTDWNEFTDDLSDFAAEIVKAKTAPPGTYPVVIDQDVVGLVLHEAFGHASEGDTVTSGASVLQGRLRTSVAGEQVTIHDEGVVEGGYYHPYDDEGVKKGRTTIVEKGILKGYITNRWSAKRLGVESTGNGRIQDFENSPIVRMTNYYMEAGDYSVEELVEDIDFGLYVQGKGRRGGQVSPGMGTFTFGVGPSRVIRDGEAQEWVRGVVIGGSILDVLQSVDAVGNNFKVKTGVFGGCGKAGQTVKVGMGGPSIRARRMTVGGR